MPHNRHNTQRVRANAVYNEYIQDKHHIHMNSTKWVTLSEFIKHLGREGLVRVDENEKGFWVSWVDTSPKALARQAEMQKRERADMDDEQRQRRQLREQMERAKAQQEALGGGLQVERGLQRDEGQKITLSLGGIKPKTEQPVEAGPSDAAKETTSAGATTTSIAAPTVGVTSAKPLSNPLKRPATTNVFKTSSKSTKTSSTSTPTSHLAGKKFLTAAERLMLEDQVRAGRKPTSGGYQGMGPSRR